MEIAMLRPLALAIGICAIVGSAAQGNDSSAELATGGLVLKKNTDIEMRSENLYISPKQIRVKYEFYNPSSKDMRLSLIHISEPTRRTPISYAVFCLKKKK